MNWLQEKVARTILGDAIVDLNEQASGNIPNDATLTADVSSLATTALSWIGESTQKVRINIQRGLADPKVISNPSGAELQLLKLIERPNPLYTGNLMRNLIARDRGMFGLGYVRMVRDDAGTPERLWFMPYDSIRKEIDGQGALVYYEYENRASITEQVQPEDMLRFPRGMSKKDPYEGEGYWDNLGSVLFVDEEAIRFTAAVFKNAIAGVMVTLDSGSNNSVKYSISRTAADLFEAKIKAGFGAKNKGAILYTNAPYKTTRLEPSFKDLSVVEFHNFAEERSMSPTGVHPTTIGLGTGLQHTRITATASEYDRKSWEDGILPVAESITDSFTAGLVPEFFDEEDEILIGYDVSHIRALRYTVAEVLDMVDRKLVTPERGASLLQLN